MNSIIKKMSLFALAFFLFSKSIFGQTANPILGFWKAEENASRQVEIYQAKDGLYYAKVLNSNNKNASNGHNLLQKLVYNAQKNTFAGKLVPPDGKIEIDATVSFDNKDKLRVVGKRFFITKTLFFIRHK